jgi:hypothetical protein
MIERVGKRSLVKIKNFEVNVLFTKGTRSEQAKTLCGIASL